MKEQEKEKNIDIDKKLKAITISVSTAELIERMRRDMISAQAFSDLIEKDKPKLHLLRRRKSLIARAPGYRMLSIVQGISPPKFRERELTALMGDASEAYYQAVASGNKWDVWRLKVLTPVWVFAVALKGAAGALVGVFTKAVKTGSE